ncbi:hypothetical protein [Helicobacter canis]|uniref:Uncharacterized protein n=1 Tax=Helicobacter canis TaxID=29419 RepID=A0A377J288_9HELI|nr:hypothetical protein [Helicobacter canis]KAA8709817.1 hypothetical protein F4V45_04060 [Helicobacter canis]STO96612.1 Uncharacterised protein [Helicobacter canis]
MPQLDGLKEDLAILKFWLGIVVASFLAIIGWLATNYNKSELWIIISSIILLFMFAFIALLINKKMRKIIKQIYESKKE